MKWGAAVVHFIDGEVENQVTQLLRNGDPGKVVCFQESRKGNLIVTSDLFCSEAFRVTKGIPFGNLHLSHVVFWAGALLICIAFVIYITAFTWNWIEGLNG